MLTFDTYRDMLHDNGFCIKPYVVCLKWIHSHSAVSLKCSNHINIDTVSLLSNATRAVTITRLWMEGGEDDFEIQVSESFDFFSVSWKLEVTCYTTTVVVVAKNSFKIFSLHERVEDDTAWEDNSNR